MRPLIALSLILGVFTAAAYEPAEDMQSEQERAGERPPGLWHGNWEVQRPHPALFTRASTLALQLEIWHAKDAGEAEVHWTTGNAICPEPADEVCEWVGVSGIAQGAVVGAALYFAAPLSADSEDPLFVHLPAAGGGAAVNARGGIAFPLEATRVP